MKKKVELPLITFESTDYTKALNGDVNQQHKLALMDEEGIGVTQDQPKALYWYSRCAKQGNATCQFNLVRMYKFGAGVDDSMETAYYGYFKAAKQGIDDSLFIGEPKATLKPTFVTRYDVGGVLI